MWDYYISAMLELNSDKTTQAGLKRSSLSRAFRAAHESNNMSESHYLQYIELLYNTKAKDEVIPKVKFTMQSGLLFAISNTYVAELSTRKFRL